MKETEQPLPFAVASKKSVPLMLRELLDKEFSQPQNEIISGSLLNRGSILVIGGPPKVRKSFLASTIAFHLATGTPLFNATKSIREDKREHVFQIRSSQRVLILEQEIGEYDLKLRFQKMLGSVDVPLQTLCAEKIFTHSCDYEMQIDTEPGVSHISQLISSCKPDIVIIDPLIEFHTGDENSAQDMSRAMAGLDRLRQTLDFSTIVVHHTSKPSKDSDRQGPHKLRGSSVLFGKADTLVILTPVSRKQDMVTVDFTLRRGKPIADMILGFNETDLRFHFDSWKNAQ